MQFPGGTLLHYEVVEPIADGALGAVCKALDTRTARRVTLLVVRPHQVDPERQRVFEQQVRAAAALNHPNIASLYEVASEGPFEVVVTEDLPEFTPLSRLRGEQFSASETLRYAIPLVDAIAAAHAAGIVHGALTASSVMLADQGRVKVLHFGLAAIAEEAVLADVIPTGTSRALVAAEQPLSEWETRISPALVPGGRLDERTDVFALGVILYEMLTGTHPFGGAPPESLPAVVPPDEPRRPGTLADVPPALDAIVMQCLRQDRGQRFASAAALSEALEGCRTELEAERSAAVAPPASRTRMTLGPVQLAAALVLLAVAAFYSARVYRGYRGARWAATAGIAEVSALAGAGRIGDAFSVASRVESFLPSTPLLKDLWRVVARDITIETIPGGADVFRKPFDAPDAPWQPVGRTPLNQVRIPREPGRWRIEKSGFATIEGSLMNVVEGDGPERLRLTLIRLEEAPAGMVLVPGGSDRRLDLAGYDELPARAVTDFWIDRYEVTNRQFKQFVDAGGYQQRELWTRPIVRAGAVLPWRGATSKLVDTTGRAGPASWVNGDFPEDQPDHPVTGVSWHEAAAYCTSVGKDLPTIWDWNAAAGIRGRAAIVPASNFGRSGPAPVGQFQGVGPWGTYDMAGNVKEWAINPASSDRGYVLGGGWRDQGQAFERALVEDSLSRQPDIGFRCVKATR